MRWPDETVHLETLRRKGVARLLLVGPDDEPPRCIACEEDWIRLPASDLDVRTRTVALATRATRHLRHPRIDRAGRLLFGDQWVALSDREAALMRSLVAAFSSVVDAEDLAHAGWPGEEGRNANLRVRLVHLRRRLAPLGLQILSVRGRGYVLERTNI